VAHLFVVSQRCETPPGVITIVATVGVGIVGAWVLDGPKAARRKLFHCAADELLTAFLELQVRGGFGLVNHFGIAAWEVKAAESGRKQ
jgi:hypothetical protein